MTNSSGTESVGLVQLVVTQSQVSASTVSVDYAVSGGTATGGGTDYTLTAGTLLIPPGNTSTSVFLSVTNDVLNENDETVIVSLSNPVNATVGSNSNHTYTITDDDAMPSLSISDAAPVIEGNSGTTQAFFTITLSAPSGRAVTFLTPASNGTARATGLTGDFLATNKLITLQPGETVTSMYVTVFGDTLDEVSNETFFVNFATATSAPMNATISDGQGQGIIIDDDPTPTLSISDFGVTEGTNGGTTSAVFTVSLSAASGQNVGFTFATSNGTATAGADYTATNGSLTILAGSNSTSLFVPVRGDSLDEASPETFFVNLTSASNATLGDAEGEGDIADDDPTPTLSVGDATVLEGNSGSTMAVFTVTLSALSGRDVLFTATSSNGTATTFGADYVATSIVVSIPAGQLTTNFAVEVLGDTFGEGVSESFFVGLSGTNNATIADGEGQGTITDDDATPAISIGDATVTEGNTGTVTAVFSINLSFASPTNVQFLVATSNGTALGGADFVTTNRVMTIPAGQTSTNFMVDVTGDVLNEAATDTFFVNISASTGFALNATIADGEGQGGIVDDDAAPTLSIGDFAVTEGDSGSTTVVFTVSLSAASGQNVAFAFATSNGTATAGADYTATNNTVTIPAGQTNGVVPIFVLGDLLDEASPETFFVNLTSPSNTSFTDAQGQGSIADNDPTPTLSIGDATVTEGNSGTTQAIFTITLSAASGRDVLFTVASSNGTATSFGNDYLSTNVFALSIPAGQLTTNFAVDVLGDLLGEGASENFFVNLSGTNNATIADGEGQGTITDDDATPTLSIGDATVTEGNTGSVAAVFAITLSAPSVTNVSFLLATSNGTALGSTDYVTTNRVITIPAGQTSTNFTVNVLGDVLNEAATDTFFVNISAATGFTMNATIADGEGQGGIVDDDAAPTLSIGDFAVTEGDSGSTTSVFTVSLSAASGQNVTFTFATSNGTATAGADYTATNNTVSIPAGQTNALVPIAILGDLLDEASPETFFVDILSASNATLVDAEGQGSIADNDPTPTLSINDVSIPEGNSGSTVAVFTVTLSAPSGRDVLFVAASSNGTASTLGNDYVATNTAVTIPAGQTTTNVKVEVLGDLSGEANETFFVDLSGTNNATLSDGEGQCTILDDDLTSTLSIGDATVTEGNSGSVIIASFPITLSPASVDAVSFFVATSNGTSLGGADYITTNKVITIPAGQTATNFSVTVVGDNFNEAATDTFFVEISSASGFPMNATLVDGEGQGNIIDDDPMPTLSIKDFAITEGDVGSTTAVFSVTLSAISGQNVAFNFATSNGTATAGADYATTNGTLTILAGQTNTAVSVDVLGDLLDEVSNETFFVNLTTASNATFADDQAQGSVLDNDPAPTISIGDATVTEGNTGSVMAVFTVTLSGPSGHDVLLTAASSNGTATLIGNDYVSTNYAVTIPAGETTTNLSVEVIGDLSIEASETFFLNLISVTNATFADAEGQGNITDDDGLPTISIADATVTEGDSGSTSAVFTISLTQAFSSDIKFDIATTNGLARSEDGDYVATNTTLTIPAGETSTNLSVSVLGDLLDEASPETFFVNISGVTNAGVAILRSSGKGSITDDDPTPTLSIDDVTITEGDSGTTTAVFSVTLSAPSGQPIQFNFDTTNGTAVAGADYVSSNGVVAIPPGVTNALIPVLVNGDVLDEASPEIFYLNLSSPTNATLADAQGAGNITDDDPTPTLSIADATVTEGDSGTTSAVFTVSLSAASGQDVTFIASSSNGTALAFGGDFVSSNKLVTIPAGQTSTDFVVLVNGDVLDEASPETFFVNLTDATNAPMNATLADGQAQGSIIDDDPTPTLSIADAVAVTEGDSGTTNAVFSITLSAPSGQTVTFLASTSNGTAIAALGNHPNFTGPQQVGDDYVTTNKLLTIPAGQTNATLSVIVNGDLLNEVSNETFFVNLSNASNATFEDAQAQGGILDDDPVPTLSIGDATMTEGDSGTSDDVFTVTLSAPSGQNVTFLGVSSNGTATAGIDFSTFSNTVLLFAGQTTTNISVHVRGDLFTETSPETFFMHIGSPSNAIVDDEEGEGDITDNDGSRTGGITLVSGPLVVTGQVHSAISDTTMTVSNSGGTVLTYSISSDQMWLSVADTGGLLAPGETAEHTIQVASRGLDARTYEGHLTIHTLGATNVSPEVDSVKLMLSPVVTPSWVMAWGSNGNGQTNVPAGLTNVISVAGGDSFTVALLENGKVLAWGKNDKGQTNVPASLTDVIAVAAGDKHVLAIRSNGTVVAWGDNTYKQTNVPAGLASVVAVSAGSGHSMALCSNGTVVAWGKNDDGETNVPSGLAGVIAIAAGSDHSMALRSSGRMMAWGKHDKGQTFVPTNLTDAVAIAGGGDYSLALHSDGRIAAWGDNTYGETNVPSSMTNIVAMAGGHDHWLAIRAGGRVLAWGNNASGQTNVSSSLTNAVMVEAGSAHSLALVPAQQYEVDVMSDQGSPTPVVGTNWAVRGMTQTLSVASIVTNGGTQYVNTGWVGTGNIPASGTSNSVRLAFSNDSSITWLWNTNYWLDMTVMGAGSVDAVDSWQKLGTNLIITASNGPGQTFLGWCGDLDGVEIDGMQIAVPMDQARSIKARFTEPMVELDQEDLSFAGQVYSTLEDQTLMVSNAGDGPMNFTITSDMFWLSVSNASGTLASGESTTEVVRVSTRGLDARTYQGHLTVVDTYLTNSPSVVPVTLTLSSIIPPSTVIAWGNNSDGQTNVPLGLTNAVWLSGGNALTVALLENGKVAAWGKNDKGQTNVPASLTSVVAVAAGEKHVLAIRSNGTVMAWGDNSSKQTNVPSGLATVVAVAAGESHSVALRANGTVVAWGKNTDGQTNVPSGLVDAVAVVSGDRHSLALRANGTVVAWGANDKKQRTVPTNLTDVVAVQAGGNYSMALRANGTIVAWGDNTYGETNVPSYMTNIVAVEAGHDHWLAKRANDQVRVKQASVLVLAWGKGDNGRTNVPAAAGNAVMVSAGRDHSLALVSAQQYEVDVMSDHGSPTPVVGVNWAVRGITQTLSVASSITDGGTQYVNTGWAGTGSVPASGTSNSVKVAFSNDSTITWLWNTNYWLDMTVMGAGSVDAVDSWQKLGTNLIITASNGPGQTFLGWCGDLDGVEIDGMQIAVPMDQARSIKARFTEPMVELDQEDLSFAGQVYSTLEDQTLMVSNAGDGPMNFTITSDMFWLSVSNASGTLASGESTTAVVRVSTRGLDARTYQGHLTIVDTYLTNSPSVVLVSLALSSVVPPSTVMAWGGNSDGQTNVPSGLTNAIGISGGYALTVALLENGKVAAWGKNDKGQTNVPASLTDAIAVAAGEKHVLAIRSNGTVMAWGDNSSKQTNVPSGLATVVAVAAGESHSVALRANGTVVAWGKNTDGQTNVPSGLTNVVAIVSGDRHSLALRANGTVVAWGANDKKQMNVPTNLTNVVAVQAGGNYSMALRANGTIVAWGDNTYGETNVPSYMTNIVAVEAGHDHWLAKRANGQVLAWGKGDSGRTNVPTSVTNAVLISAGRDHSLALVSAQPFVLKMSSKSGASQIPESWLSKYGLSSDALNKDADADGMTTLSEYVADLDPNDAASVFRIVQVSTADGQSTVTFESSSARIYTLEILTGGIAGTWTPVAGQVQVAGNGGVLTLIDVNPPAASHYYRVRVEVP